MKVILYHFKNFGDEVKAERANIVGQRLSYSGFDFISSKSKLLAQHEGPAKRVKVKDGHAVYLVKNGKAAYCGVCMNEEHLKRMVDICPTLGVTVEKIFNQPNGGDDEDHE